MKVSEPKVLVHPRFGGPAGHVSDVPREEKVTRLRAVIAQGNYSADIQDVARRFLRELLGELLA